MGRGTWLMDLLFPRKCPFCAKILEGEALLCGSCQSTLPWLMGQARERQVDFAAVCLSPLAYTGGVRDSIHRYKFPGNPGYARCYGLLVAQCVEDQWPHPLDQVTWVPVSWRRREKRGFDQGKQLAAETAGALKLPLTHTLVKRRHTPQQSRLTETAQRRANVLGAYAVRPEAEVEGKRLLLIDDVVTSGATLSECARILMQAGAREVVCATLAQARKK